MVRTAIQVSALTLTFGAAVLLVRSGLTMTPQVVATLSSTYWDHNADAVRALSFQGAETQVGVALLMLAALLQLVNLLWPMYIDDYAPARCDWCSCRPGPLAPPLWSSVGSIEETRCALRGAGSSYSLGN